MKQIIETPNEKNVEVEPLQEVKELNMKQVIGDKIKTYQNKGAEDSFFVADLGDIVKKLHKWQELLPRVEPFYAVKCNDNPLVCETLAALGTGFDCASKSEIEQMLRLGVSADRIIYANPCKQTSHIRFAAANNVALMTFDNEVELRKVKKVYPNAKLVLRLLPPEDSKCQCQLGMKFGCHPKQVSSLLQEAKNLDLDVVGISFHVGSGCYDARAFSAAVESARVAFNEAQELGYKLTLLDIGGGFPGQVNANITMEQIVEELGPALDKHFPVESGIRIIAEPGRYFVASAFTLCVGVIAKRAVNSEGLAPDGDDLGFMYYVNDGVYGSFNCLLFDHAEVTPKLLHDPVGKLTYPCSVWGPTCDGLDCIKEKCMLPELNVGDYLQFDNMGAYTSSAATTFNGMAKPSCYYVAASHVWEDLRPRLELQQAAHIVSEVKVKSVGCDAISPVANLATLLQQYLSTATDDDSNTDKRQTVVDTCFMF